MTVQYDNFIFQLQYAGGISKVWYNLINILQTNNNVDLRFVEGNHINNLFREQLDINPDKIFKETTKNRYIRRFKCVENAGCDVYHSSYFRPLCKKNTSKVVVTIHDFIYEKYSSYLSTKAHVYLKNKALNQADAIICVSENTRQDFFRYYPKIAREKVHVVYNGVDNLFSPIKQIDPLVIHDIELKKNNYLLYVGNRGYCKNFGFVLNLMASDLVKEKNLKLICIGGGNPNKQEIKEMEQLKISNNIHFLSKISSVDLNKIYNNAFCLLFPSIYEGFGIPVVEAMKAGCPVWSSNSSSVIELTGEDYPFLFDPGCWDSALKAFGRMLDPSNRKLAVKYGIKRSKCFSWKKCAYETLKIYNELCQN